MPLQLSPGQAVTLHGWLRPRQTLRWADVVDSPHITYDRCRVARLAPKSLQQLQPSVPEWIAHGGVLLAHAPELAGVWDFDLVTDFRVDLADVLSMRWHADTLRRLRVTYEDLVGIGLTPETMHLFGFSLLGWASLGFRCAHLAALGDAHIGG
eukprot:3936202-Rhodomonas_salina.1